MGTLIQLFLNLFGKSIKAKVMDAILGNILGGGGKKGQADGGVLGSMMEKFKEKGLGNVFNSWVGKGANMAISPEQVRETIGDEKLKEMSQQTGLSLDALTAEVAKYLPKMVDKMTPDGKLPG